MEPRLLKVGFTASSTVPSLESRLSSPLKEHSRSTSRWETEPASKAMKASSHHLLASTQKTQHSSTQTVQGAQYATAVVEAGSDSASKTELTHSEEVPRPPQIERRHKVMQAAFFELFVVVPQQRAPVMVGDFDSSVRKPSPQVVWNAKHERNILWNMWCRTRDPNNILGRRKLCLETQMAIKKQSFPKQPLVEQEPSSPRSCCFDYLNLLLTPNLPYVNLKPSLQQQQPVPTPLARIK